MNNKQNIHQAVILSGGRGERLMPFTKDKNKGMVEVAGRPFLEHLIELFKANGIRKFLILTGHAAESIENHFGNGKKWRVEISYHYAPPEINHGKRLALALPQIDDIFLLHRNDIYWPFNLRAHLDHFSALKLPALMTVYINKKGDGIYGPNNNVRVNERSIIERYDPTLSADPFYQGQDIGFFIFNKQAFLDNLPLSLPDTYDLHHDFLSTLAEKGLLGAYQTNIPATTTTDTGWLKKAEKYLQNLAARMEQTKN
ncbi:MAG: NTP transferase domain-containing protein [Candidatus Taylorbacteria bacterium]|nr:NTP transferase domain-containing protein [Candidatus Taylorbacteria bacterium]